MCSRRPSFEDEINVLTDGNQSLRSARAVAPLATGRALVTFIAQVGETRQAARGILVDPDGAPVNTCGEPNEVTYSTFREGGPADQLAAFPVYAAARDAEAEGFLTWSFVEGDVTAEVPDLDMRVEGRFVGADGCTIFEEEQPAPWVFDDPPRGVIVGPPQAARVGEERFVLAWPRGQSFVGARDGGVFVQVFREGPFGRPEFEPVRDPESGEVVDGTAPVRVAGGSASAVSVVPLRDGRFGLLARREVLLTQAVAFAVLEDTLDVVIPFRELDRYGIPASSIAPALAFDGERFLAVWTRSDPAAGGVERVVATFLDLEGRPLPTPHSPSGEPFFLTGEARQQEDPTVTALPEGRGFLVAWGDSNQAESEDAIRAMVLDPDGEVGFANPACDRADFQVHGELSGLQEAPSAAVLPDGTVLIGWTDRGANGRDLSGSSVRLQRGDLATYLPLR
ncbi:MAG: hypothetical protein ACFCGT_10180 [Sandaracinaceae bacterium]